MSGMTEVREVKKGTVREIAHGELDVILDRMVAGDAYAGDFIVSDLYVCIANGEAAKGLMAVARAYLSAVNDALEKQEKQEKEGKETVQ